MDLLEQVKRLIQAATKRRVAPSGPNYGLDILVRLQTLLGALGYTDDRVTQWFRENNSVGAQKKALQVLRRKLPKARHEFFSLRDTDTYRKALQSADMMTKSTQLSDLSGSDIMQDLIMGFSIGETDSGVRKMIYAEIGRHLKDQIKQGTASVMQIGNTAAKFARQAVLTVADTRARQRGRKEPIHLQPGSDATRKQHEIPTFHNLGLRDRFEVVVDILIAGSGPTPTDPLGRKILQEIYKIISRLPTRQAATGRAWFDLLLERSNRAGRLHLWGINTLLAKQLGRDKSTISYTIKKVMDSITNELPKNSVLTDEIEKRLQQEELGFGLKKARQQKLLATKIAFRYFTKHHSS